MPKNHPKIYTKPPNSGYGYKHRDLVLLETWARFCLEMGSGKLYLPRDLRWVEKRTRKFPLKYTQVTKKKHFKADISCISLAKNTLMDVTQLALTWFGWPNGEKLASTWVQIWSRPQWTQVHASSGQTKSRVDPSFELASTCDSVWSGL